MKLHIENILTIEMKGKKATLGQGEYEFVDVNEFIRFMERLGEQTKQPLIKDEKIRKAIKIWARLNNVDKVEYNTYPTDDCSFVFTCDNDIELLLDFRYEIGNLTGGKKYTIAELCGEEKE